MGGIIGSVLGFLGTEDTNATNEQIAQNNNAFNAQQALQTEAYQTQSIQSQEDYATQMSNSAYQRTVKDMEAAGLNPMLAYSQGGASTPMGSTSSGAQATAAANPNIQNPFAAGMAGYATAAQIQNTQADTEQKTAQAEKTKAETQTELGRPSNLSAQTDLVRKQAEKTIREADLTDTKNKQAQAEIDNIFKEGKRIDADTALKKVNEILQRYDIPHMQSEAGFYKSDAGKHAPYFEHAPKDLVQGVGGYLGYQNNSAYKSSQAIPNVPQGVPNYGFR